VAEEKQENLMSIFMPKFKTVSLAAAASIVATSAFAGTFDGTCTTEPQAKWPAAAMAEAKAKEAGYDVSKSKVAGTCYEVYASKAEKRFELFYNPMTAELVHTVAK
jgi:hypothetical protein